MSFQQPIGDTTVQSMESQQGDGSNIVTQSMLRMFAGTDNPQNRPQREAWIDHKENITQSRRRSASTDSPLNRYHQQRSAWKNIPHQPLEDITINYFMLRMSVSSDLSQQFKASKFKTHEYNHKTTRREKDVRKEVVIDIVREELLEPSRRHERCIYEVPKKLRKIKKDAYTPKLISIGPLHYDNQELRKMKIHKLRYFRYFCSHRSNLTGEDYFEKLKRIVEEHEETIRHSYAVTSKLHREEYVSMILLDAIFIIEVFLRRKLRHTSEEFDYILSTPWLRSSIRQDLILLENQLPLFILNKLFKTTGYYSGLGTDASFLELAYDYFKEDYSKYSNILTVKEVKHFTDLHRHFLCPPSLERARKYQITTRSATKLDDAGVRFKAVKKEDEPGRHLLDIKFQKHKYLEYCPWLNCSWILNCLPFLKNKYLERMQPLLKLPPFEVDDNTESLYRNVMALEQCHYPDETYVCDYIALLDDLIDTVEDVFFLVDKEVIVNKIGSNDALAKLINKLCLEIVYSNYSCYYDELRQNLHLHCNSPWNKIMATMTSTYFRDFWRGTATIVALIALGITLYNFIKQFV